MVLVVWPISNIFLIALVGYDTDIIKSINQCKRSSTITFTNDTIDTKYIPKDKNQTRQHHSHHAASSSTAINEPIPMSSPCTDDKASSFPLPRLSNTTALNIDDDSESTKTQGASSDISSISCCTIVNIENYQKRN
ncbi:hypothetical protein G6F42_025446 [Rhizopus arrhizus]|nr:hypothetical protein G6F42_025446 [Rhizopus arrhizus]